jgi:lysozyme family protein
MTDFNQAFELIIGVEGGYVSAEEAKVRGDAGGETNLGISKRQYPDEDIAGMTLERSKFLYKRDYWDVLKCDQMSWPLSLFVFDAGVNQGCDARANFATQKMLQKVADVPQDGILGVNTMAKIAKFRKFHVAKFMAVRAMRYTGTRSFDQNGVGWFVRLFTLAMQDKG